MALRRTTLGAGSSVRDPVEGGSASSELQKNRTNVVQGQGRETSEAKVHLAVPDCGLVGHDDGFWVASGTAGVDDSDG